MTVDALLEKIQIGEDSSFELKNLVYKGEKVNSPHRDSMADEMAAMANTNSGIFVLGVDDKTRVIVGIPFEKLNPVTRWIEGICNDLIKPKLFCLINRIPIKSGDITQFIIRIDIPKSLFVHRSPSGYFHRIGGSKRQLDTYLLARLLQQRSQTRIIHFDQQLVANANKHCLDKDLWIKFKSITSTDKDETFLLKLKLIVKDEGGNLYPSVSGILMACKEPHDYIPNAYIQAIAYRGKERNAAYQLDAEDILGPLDLQVKQAYQFVKKNMKIHGMKNPARIDIPQYDMQAVFEALVNAVVHRDYSIHGSKIRLHMFSDRIELFSPGALANTISIDTLEMRQITRNELLASLISQCRLPSELIHSNRNYLMDKRGEGVPIILTNSTELSKKKPKYQLIDESELLLTIYAAEPSH